MENKKEEKVYTDARFDVIKKCTSDISKVIDKYIEKYGMTIEEQCVIQSMISAQMVVVFGGEDDGPTHQELKEVLLSTVSGAIDNALRIKACVDAVMN